MKSRICGFANASIFSFRSGRLSKLMYRHKPFRRFSGKSEVDTEGDGFCAYSVLICGSKPLPGRSTTALGRNIDRIERNIESIESKITKIFKRPKNREDGSDFDDFWTESIRLGEIYLFKNFRTSEKLSNRSNRSIRSVDRPIDRIDRRPP